jgi:hypothetical protein
MHSVRSTRHFSATLLSGDVVSKAQITTDPMNSGYLTRTWWLRQGKAILFFALTAQVTQALVRISRLLCWRPNTYSE